MTRVKRNIAAIRDMAPNGGAFFDPSTSNVFVDFDLIDRIVGVSTYHPQARIRSALLNH